MNRITNGQHDARTQLALVVAYDALAYLTITMATMTGHISPAMPNPAWDHIETFLANAEFLLSTIEPDAALIMHDKIKLNAAAIRAALQK